MFVKAALENKLLKPLNGRLFHFSLSVIKPMHWVISLGIIVLSGPLITKIVDIFRVRVNKKFKVKTT